MITLYSIGHSRHPPEHFLSLLRGRGIAVLVDVRSHPSSRWAPHFGRASLQSLLRAHGIGYEFLGRELGGRPRGAEFYAADGAVDYARRAQAAEFLAGIASLVEVARQRRAVVLCAEEDPERCHRRRLIAPAVASAGCSVVHIRGDGRLEAEVTRRAEPGQLGLFG